MHNWSLLVLLCLRCPTPALRLTHALKPAARSAGVTAAAELHLVQQRPSNICWVSSQCKGGQTTSRQRIGSALLFIPTPPLMPAAQDLSSGTFTESAQQSGQHVPVSSLLLYLKGDLQSMGLHEMPSHVSVAAVGE